MDVDDSPILAQIFEVQAAFAMTFQKLQGATMDSLVAIMSDLSGMKLGAFTCAKVNYFWGLGLY